MSHKIECRLNAVNVILSRETESKQKAKIVEATSHTNANEQPELIAQHTIGCARVCRLILSFAQLHWPVTTIVGCNDTLDISRFAQCTPHLFTNCSSRK